MATINTRKEVSGSFTLYSYTDGEAISDQNVSAESVGMNVHCAKTRALLIASGNDYGQNATFHACVNDDSDYGVKMSSRVEINRVSEDQRVMISIDGYTVSMVPNSDSKIVIMLTPIVLSSEK